MALQPQNAVFPMVRGVDTRSDQKQLVTGTMEVLENAQLSSPGQFKKRNGYENLAEVSNPNGLGILNNELVVFADNQVLSYSPSLEECIPTKAAPTTTGELNLEPMQLRINRGIVNSESFIQCDSAYHSNGRIAYVGCALTLNSYFSIIDSESNAILYGPKKYLTSTESQGKVFTVGGNFIIVYYDTTSLKYIAVPTNTSSGELDSATTITSTMPGSGRTFDGCVLNGILYIVWGTDGTDIGIASFDNFTLKTTILPTGDTVTNAVNIAPDETLTSLSVSYYNGTKLKYIQCSTLLVTTSGPTDVDTVSNLVSIATFIDNNTGYIFYEIAGSGTPSGTFFNNFVKRSSISAGSPGGGNSWVRSVGIVSKPFTVTVNGDDVTCIMVGYTGAQPAVGQGTVFILNESATVIGKLSPGNCYGIGAGSHGDEESNCLPEVNVVDNSTFVSSFIRADFGYSDNGAQHSTYGVWGSTYDFDSLENYQNSTAANNLHITTGILGMYDGQQYVEHGFHLIAEAPISGTPSYNSSDNNFPTGTYSYQIVPEWIDAQGNFHQGVPSTAFAVPVIAPQTAVALVIPTLRLTLKDKVYLSVYRNTLAAPTVFNRISATLSSSQLNDKTVDTITVSDTSTDAMVETHQLIYTTGDVVPDYSVPSPRFVCGYRNRMVVLPAETPNILWLSKSIVQGIPGVPVEFSAFFTIQVNTLGGDIYAFSQMDEKGIIFKRNSIFYFVGDGPSDTGSNNDISVPQQVPTDTGTTNQRSVLLMHDGIMYQSEGNGIYLLDRSLGVSYIGAPVEAYNNDTVLSSQIVPNSTQVRFLLDSGVVLVYDYIVKQWDVYTNHSAVDAVIYQGIYTYLGTSGKILQETLGEFSDDGSFIKMKLKTGWLSFAGIQGFQRVWKMLLLGTYYGPHSLLVSIAYDFNPNVVDTILINPGSILPSGVYGSDATYGLSTPYGGENGYPLEQFTVYPTIQKCESIQVTIEDVQNGTTIGESYAISSLGFLVGIEGGLQRQPTTRKFG